MRPFWKKMMKRAADRKYPLLAFALFMALPLLAAGPPGSRTDGPPDGPLVETPLIAEGGAVHAAFPSPFTHIESVAFRISCDDPSPGAHYLVRVRAGDALIAQTRLTGPFVDGEPIELPVARADDVTGRTIRIEVEGVSVPDGQGLRLYASPYTDASRPLSLNGTALTGWLALSVKGIVVSREKAALWLAVALGGLCALMLLGKRVERNFLVIAAILGLLVAIANPIGEGFDEHRHFARAWLLSEGGLAPAVTRDGAAIPVPTDLTPLTTQNCYRLGRAFKDLWYRPTGRTVLSREYAVESAAFATYLPAAAGVALGRLLRLPLALVYYLGRTASLAVYAALGYLALRVARCKLVFFALGLLPQALVLAGSYSADPMLISLALLFAALWTRYAQEGMLTLQRIALMAGILALAALIKAPYAALALLLAFTPCGAFARPRLRWAALGAAALTAALAAGWLLTVRAVWGAVPNSMMLDGSANALAQMRFIAAHPAAAARTLLRSFAELPAGWLAELSEYAGGGYSAGVWVALTPIVLAFAAGAGSPMERSARRAMLWASVLSACALAVFTYLAWSPVGAELPWGIQGRYFIPALALLLPALSGWVRPDIKDIEFKLGWIMTAMGCWTLASMIGYYY